MQSNMILTHVTKWNNSVSKNRKSGWSSNLRKNESSKGLDETNGRLRSMGHRSRRHDLEMGLNHWIDPERKKMKMH